MKVQYELSYQDFRAAGALVKSTHKAARLQGIAGIVLPAIGALIIGLFAILVAIGNEQMIVSSRPAFYISVGLLILPVLARLGQWQTYKRAFPDAHGPRLVTVVLDEDGVSCGQPGLAETRYGWSTVQSFVENKKIALIYVAQVSFIMLPKRLLSVEQLGDIRSLIHRRDIEMSEC